MKIAASMSVGRLAPKHSLNIDNIRVISKNVTPKLIRDDVVILDRLRGQDGKHLTIEEYTDQHFQPYIDQYNSKQRRSDRQIKTGYCEWHRNNGNLSQGKGEIAYEAVLQYGTHEDIGGEYYAADTSPERKEALRQEYTQVYQKWTEDIQRDFPHLTILYAVIHFSEQEGTPHLHLCFQPEADSNRGIAKQVSIGKALAQDGIERIDTRAEAEQAGGFQLARFYQRFHHEYQNPTLQRLGYEIKEETHGLKHMEKDGYSTVIASAHEQADSLVQAAQSRQERVSAEVEKAKAKALNLVYQAQEAAEAAKTEKAKAEEAKALAQLEQARAEAQAEASRQEAEAAQLEKQRADQARIQAERERAKVEAQTEELKERTRAEANARAVELEWQLSQAQAYIAQQEGIIATLREKLEQVREYLMHFNAVQHFYEWVTQRFYTPEPTQELDYEERDIE